MKDRNMNKRDQWIEQQVELIGVALPKLEAAQMLHDAMAFADAHREPLKPFTCPFCGEKFEPFTNLTLPHAHRETAGDLSPDIEASLYQLRRSIERSSPTPSLREARVSSEEFYNLMQWVVTIHLQTEITTYNSSAA